MPKSQQLDAKPSQKVPQRTPAERAKAYIARISAPAANPANVKINRPPALHRGLDDRSALAFWDPSRRAY